MPVRYVSVQKTHAFPADSPICSAPHFCLDSHAPNLPMLQHQYHLNFGACTDRCHHAIAYLIQDKKMVRTTVGIELGAAAILEHCKISVLKKPKGSKK